MATIKNAGFGSYCNKMYNELSHMRTTALGFVSEIERMKGPERKMLEPHIAHFQDIAKTIEWKLEILLRVCPYDWAGYSDVQKTASVKLDEELARKYPAGVGAGDVGG